MKNWRLGTSGGLAWIFLALAMALNTQAARVEIPVQVDVGFGAPLTASGKLYPVTITMDNKVASTRGIIEVLQPNPSGKQEVRYELPFELPSPSVKQFAFYVPLDRAYQLSVSIRFEEHLKAVRTRPRLSWDERRRVLAVGLPSRQRRWTPNKDYALQPVSVEQLPGDAIGYDSIYALMMSGRALEGVDASRLTAIHEWVHAGGILLLSDVSSGPVFRARAQQICGDDSSVDLERKGIQRLGAGSVVSSGILAESDQPFWIEDAPAVSALFPRVDEQSLHMYGGAGVGFFFQLFSGSRSLGAAGFLWLIVIIVGYVVVIGPVDWSLSRKFKKPYLTWWFFATAIVLFSCLAYGYSRIVNTGITQALYLNTIDTSPSMDVFKGASRIGVYSAANKRYRITPRVKGVVMGAQESAMTVGAAAGVTVQLAPESSIVARIPIFSSKQFNCAWYGSGRGRVTRQEGSSDDDIDFVVSDLPGVSAAFLARREGLVALNVTTSAESGSDLSVTFLHGRVSRVINWQEALQKRAQHLNSHQYNRGGRSNRKSLPTEDELQRYLICMGFAYNPNVPGGDTPHDWQFQNLYNSRDAFERNLNLVEQLNHNDVLMLMLPDMPDLTPVAVQGSKPETGHYTCIRVLWPRP